MSVTATIHVYPTDTIEPVAKYGQHWIELPEVRVFPHDAAAARKLATAFGAMAERMEAVETARPKFTPLAETVQVLS